MMIIDMMMMMMIIDMIKDMMMIMIIDMMIVEIVIDDSESIDASRKDSDNHDRK